MVVVSTLACTEIESSLMLVLTSISVVDIEGILNQPYGNATTLVLQHMVHGSASFSADSR